MILTVAEPPEEEQEEQTAGHDEDEEAQLHVVHSLAAVFLLAGPHHALFCLVGVLVCTCSTGGIRLIQ